MSHENSLLVGEFRRTIDERYRLSIPTELANPLLANASTGGELAVLAKERPGCLSLWNVAMWRDKLASGVKLVEQKIAAGRLEGRIEEVQRLGRLLSTRHTEVPFAGRGRLVLPEGFREFLGVEPGGDLFVVGAALCVELWRPDAWFQYINEQIPDFRRLFDSLSS
jgi:MraZ protein